MDPGDGPTRAARASCWARSPTAWVWAPAPAVPSRVRHPPLLRLSFSPVTQRGESPRLTRCREDETRECCGTAGAVGLDSEREQGRRIPGPSWGAGRRAPGVCWGKWGSTPEQGEDSDAEQLIRGRRPPGLRARGAKPCQEPPGLRVVTATLAQVPGSGHDGKDTTIS